MPGRVSDLRSNVLTRARRAEHSRSARLNSTRPGRGSGAPGPSEHASVPAYSLAESVAWNGESPAFAWGITRDGA